MNFEILGPLRVVDSEYNEVNLGGAKPAAVLALLILNANEVVSSDRLIDELWERQPPATAAKSLQVHISRLRRALMAGAAGDVIVTRSGGYALDVDPGQVDAQRFERSVAEGRAALTDGGYALASARLRSALALWRGPALADFAYASFAQDAIARLDGLRTVALEGAVEAELALGRHTELIPELKSLVRRHPLSERLRGQLMLALYRAGRQAEALGAYRAGRRVLVDQLGIEPSSDLRELERQILSQDPELNPPARERRPRPAPATGGALVGYENELRALEDVLEQALVGQGSVALVSGEPGVGKTRLADELARVAQMRQAQVAWARCWDGAGTPAFWPWTQILRTLIADRPPETLRAELGNALSDLGQLVPELIGVEAVPPEPNESADARFRLFEATAMFLRRVAHVRPLVLLFDDLHAADPSTLSLLSFIAASVVNLPVLIIGTYRDTAVSANEPLSEALTELTRTNDCLQLVLTGLTRADTAHLVETAAEAAPMASLAGAIHEVSAGNPLFVSELVRLLRAEHRLAELGPDDVLVLPRGIDQVIARRVKQLSAAGRQMLSVAAVIGNEVDIALLHQIAGSTPQELLEQIEESQAARVLAPSRDAGSVRFAHDLVRQALYADLSLSDCKETHARVAQAIEHLNEGQLERHAPQIAHHYVAALPLVDPSVAIRFAALAGDASAELLAYEDAISWYERAIQLAAAHDAGRALQSELYVKVAEQAVHLSDEQRGAAALDRAEVLAGGALSPALAGRTTIARAEFDLADACAVGRERVEEVVTLFQTLDDAAGEARAWNAMLAFAHGHARFDDVAVAAQHALECAQRAGSQALIEQAVRGLGVSLAHGSTPVSRAVPELQQLFPLSRNGSTKGRLFLCLAQLDTRAAHFDEARARVAEARAAAGPSMGESWDTTSAARLELAAGNAARAEAIMRKACDDLERRGLNAFLCSAIVYLAEALIAQGRLDEAEAELKRVRPHIVETDTDARHGHARTDAALQLARGEHDEAEISVLEALAFVAQMQWPDARIQTELLHSRILFAQGRDADARAAADSALASSELLELQLYAERARELLRTRSSAPAAALRT